MKIYNVEKELGLAEEISAQSSIAFHVPASNSVPITDVENRSMASVLAELALAGDSDPDVYKTYSILVSTVWNKNDDIFDNAEVWAARNTPRFKPTNLDHDEKQIIGNIADSWAIDEDLNLIPDDTKAEDISGGFHLLVASVIYRQWQDEELRNRAEKLIAEIEEGDMYVSMECLFNNFDYGIVDPSGANHIVARTESTAFLSQFLRSYGGDGEYQGHKIGRVLRNITFSGKGYVKRPANPASVIFDKEQHFSFASPIFHEDIEKNDFTSFSKNGVSYDIREDLNVPREINNMTIEQLTAQVSELKASLDAAKAENKEMVDQLSKANVAQYEDQIAKFEASIAAQELAMEELNTQLTEAIAKNEVLAKEISDKDAALAEVKASYDKMEEEKKKKERKDKMAESGFSQEEIEVKYDTFASMSDEQFDSVMETIASLKPQADTTETTEASDSTEEEEETEESTEASEVVDEETETGNTSAAADSTDDTLSVARAGFQEWTTQILSNK